MHGTGITALATAAIWVLKEPLGVHPQVAILEPLMPQLNTKDGKLFVDETEVLEGYESFSGWYWFITERDAYGEGIHFAFVQGTHDEWGSVSQQELESLYPKVWKINDIDLPHAGRR